jgi:iron complex outermembrane recepter protein
MLAAYILFLSILALPLTGLIVDASTHEPIPGATVVVAGVGVATATDDHGRFRLLNLPDGPHNLQVRHVAYQGANVTVDLPADSEIRIELHPVVYGSDEVIVTATVGATARYQAAQAFDAETLQRSAGIGLGEMLDGAPGVAMRSFGPVPSRPVIRGLDGDRILVLENGERMGDLAETAPDHAVGMDMLAIDRVEIVRGPASLLYGSSALGGVINLFSEDIPRSWTRGTSGSALMHGASVNRLGAGSMRIVHGAENWAAAGRLSVRGAGEMMTPEGLLPGTFLRSYSGAVGASHRTGDRRIGLSATTLGSTYGLPEALDDPDESVEIRMWRTNVSGLAQWERTGPFEAVEFRVSATAYGHDEVEIEFENGVVEEDLELSFHQKSVTATLTARHGGLGLLSGGAIGTHFAYRTIDVGGDESLTPDGRSLNAAIFALEEIPLTSALRVSAGGRYEYQWLEISPNDRFPSARGTRDAHTFSGAAGLNLRPLANVELGAQVARAFRTPRLEELHSDAAHIGAGAYEIGNPHLRNEVSTGADAFLVMNLGRSTLELSAFTNYIRDFVIYQPTGEIHGPSGLPIIEYEADNAHLVGGELRFITPLVGHLTADLSADVVRGTRRGMTAEPLPFIPPVRSRIAFAYDDGTWFAGTTVRLAATQSRVAPGEDPTPGYAIIGAEFLHRIHAGNVHVVGLRLDNVTNRLYRDHLSRIEERDAPMPGRNINLTYRWIF